jgi:hypothetical protein
MAGKRPMLKRLLMSILLGGMIAYAGGCASDKLITAVKVDGRGNTFALSEADWGGNITKVVVWSGDEARKVLWKIEAAQDVPAKGFAVTVGEVPAGFRQTVPPPPEKFSPSRGEIYWIRINAAFSPHAWPMETIWQAE